MSQPTRVTHTVRCRSKTNPQIFADVVVVDAVTLQQPNGNLFIIDVTAKRAQPAIVDTTGSGYGVQNQTPSRVSHVERFTSQDDPTQIMDIEILDAFAVQPPSDGSSDVSGPDDQNDQQNFSGAGGELDAGQDGAAVLRDFQQNSAISIIGDKTGLGLSNTPGTGATRSGHINLVTNAGNSDDKTQFSDGIADTVPPVAHQFLANVKVDEIAFTGLNGNLYNLSAPPTLATDTDATKYVTDPYTQEPNSPPDNKDPNMYVVFPDNSNGCNLGAQPKSSLTNKTEPICMGPFWWIKKISGVPNPWFWWCPVQTPLAVSFFGSGGSWPWRGPILWNNYPVIWILSENNPIAPMGNFGSDSLNTAATIGNWDNQGTIPSAPIWTGGQFAGQTFGPFGYIPVLDPPAKPTDNGGTNYDNVLPNAWQLTGITQPNLSNPNKSWNRVSNPYLFPSSSKWEQMAMTFQANWQAVANAMNAAVPGLLGGSDFNFPNGPPEWPWSIPYQTVGGPHGYNSFQNGIEPLLVGGYHIPLEVFVPITTATLNMGQLDPKTWDTRPAMKQDQGQIGFGNPVTWASEQQPH